MILNFILANMLLLPDLNWLGYSVNLILIFGFFVAINWTFQSDKKAYFDKQSRIPLDDDTLAEKHFLNKQRKNIMNYERFDA